MNFLFLTFTIAMVFVVASRLHVAVALSKLRTSGVYPMPGQASMADVGRLKKLGLTVWAVRCYREIHGCRLREAKESVQRLG